MSERRLLNKHDIWIFAGLAVLALSLYIFSGGSSAEAEYAEISVNGQVVLTIPLAEIGEKMFTLDEPNVQFFLTDGAVSFYSSDCPDQICVHRGFLSQPGEAAVCLPNRTVLQIIGAESSGDGTIDMVAH